MRTAAIYLLLLILLGIGDIRLTAKADAQLRRSNANMVTRLAAITLDPNGPRRQGCRFARLYGLYAYQTCFMKNWGSNAAETTFSYVYHRPLPLFFTLRETPESSRFQASELGERLAVISNGTVVYEHVPDEPR